MDNDEATLISEHVEQVIDDALENTDAAIEAAEERAEAAEELSEALADAALATAQGQRIETLSQGLETCRTMLAELSNRLEANRVRMDSVVGEVAALVQTLTPPPLPVPPTLPTPPEAAVILDPPAPSEPIPDAPAVKRHRFL